VDGVVLVGLALGERALEGTPALGVGLADLADRREVQGVVEASVAALGDPVHDPATGGTLDRRGAVVGRAGVDADALVECRSSGKPAARMGRLPAEFRESAGTAGGVVGKEYFRTVGAFLTNDFAAVRARGRLIIIGANVQCRPDTCGCLPLRAAGRKRCFEPRLSEDAAVPALGDRRGLSRWCGTRSALTLRRHQTELLHHAHLVDDAPVVRTLAVDHTEDVDHRDLETLAGRWDSHQLAS
jgi:hypothetical protein